MARLPPCDHGERIVLWRRPRRRDFIRASASSSLAFMRRTLRPDKKPVAVGRRAIRQTQENLPSLAVFGNDVLLLIMELLDAESIRAIKLVCSQLYHLGQYVSQGELTMRVYRSEAADTWAFKDAQLSPDALAAAQILRVVNGWQAKDPKLLNTVKIEKLLSSMPNLRELHLTHLLDTLEVLMIASKSPRLLFHVESGDYRPPWGKDLNGTIPSISAFERLVSLNLSTAYHTAEECLAFTRPAKEVLMTSKVLKHLTLNIRLADGGCVRTVEPVEYHGLGFIAGERPLCALESLTIDCYPFSRWGHGQYTSECEYWARTFDWSQLKCLRVSYEFWERGGSVLAPYLTALKIFDTGYIPIYDSHHGYEWEVYITESMARTNEFLENIPSPLHEITAQSLRAATLPAIIRHADTLRALRLHQGSRFSNHGHDNPEWAQEAMTAADLHALSRACPLITTLGIDVARSQVWPYDVFDALAELPRLQDLTMWFQEAIRSRDQRYHYRYDPSHHLEPRVDEKAARFMFDYIRGRRRYEVHRRAVAERADGDDGEGVAEVWVPQPSLRRLTAVVLQRYKCCGGYKDEKFVVTE